VWDADGNRYVDYLMAWGSVLLGHGHGSVEKAVLDQISRATILNLGFEGEIALAERIIQHVPGVDLVRFVASGSEATNAAIRVARAATGREKIIRFGYHGWNDWCQSDHPGGIPRETLRDVLQFDYNDIESVRDICIRYPKELACLIMEPLKGRLPDRDFLQKVAEVLHEFGALLILDEVKTGFRLGLGGAQEYFNLRPDLTVFSKAMGNGFPIGAVAGRAEVFERASGAWISGTFHGWPPAVAASHATITVLEQEPVNEHVWHNGTRLMDGFNKTMASAGLSTRLSGLAPMPHLDCPPNERRKLDSFFEKMIQRGYFIHPIHPWYVSFAHDSECIEETLFHIEQVSWQLVD
jgi:glutamate-1-semialdehyde 2,1-aminomutase